VPTRKLNERQDMIQELTLVSVLLSHVFEALRT